MKSIACLIISLTICIVPSFVLAFDPSQELRSYCKQVVGSRTDAGSIELDDKFGAGFCFGIFQTINNLASARDKSAGVSIPNVCIPPNTATSTLIQVFMAQAEEIPPVIKVDYFDVAMKSLLKAYPCK